jgi:excinuclease ABC subunit A
MGLSIGTGPGDGGGIVVAEATPEDVAKVKASHTGRYLGKVLRGESLNAGK